MSPVREPAPGTFGGNSNVKACCACFDTVAASLVATATDAASSTYYFKHLLSQQIQDCACFTSSRHRVRLPSIWLIADCVPSRSHAILHLFNCFLQVTTVGHFCDDVTASQQLTANIQLRECWPVRHLLEPLSNMVIRQDIKRLKRLLCCLQCCNNTLAEAAARFFWRPCSSSTTS